MSGSSEGGAERRSIDQLIASFAEHEPPFSSLGTPFLVDTEETEALVRKGEAAVPALETALEDDDPSIVMYAAYCLGFIGDRSALPALRRTRARHEARAPMQAEDYAVISAISQAEERLYGTRP
ncbi:MAG TPA: HEAT repeat domain-containing protein [Rubrobacteraceae bacterium]|nr:HEAT repeat domain-containing protein [Rubrobacteraceae bacterium]